MRTRTTAVSLGLLFVFTYSAPFILAQNPPATRPAGEADVPVKEVVLFSSGVGYFEHSGSVRGDGSTVLHFKTDQINDILKSLVLEDLDGGKVGTVSYPSQSPLDRTLKSFQVDITSNPPLPQLLNQLRGARISVSTINGPLEGIILGVEKKQRVIGEKSLLDIHVLNLRSGHVIHPIALDDVQSLEMDDAKLNQELDAALAALAQARDQDKKPVAIHFNGQGERRVRIGYVVETPVWKTSYRLVLDNHKPANGDAKSTGGKLQGWAIIENQTDNDWNDVQLKLVSGRPISFIEDLYHSLYVPRPYVEPQLYASLMPQTYENGITQADLQKMRQARANDQQRAAVQNLSRAAGGAGGAQPQISNQLFANAQQLNNPAGQTEAPPIDPVASVVSAASASGLGELFQYTVGNVSIKRQQSAMIPIVTDDVDAKKVSIYNRGVLSNHPLNGVRLKNTTGKHLLAGPVTLIEAGSYAGDAQINDVPPDQQRLLSYGIDLKVLVDVTDDPQYSSVVVARLVKGVLKLQWKDTSQITYRFNNKGEVGKTLVLEHPRYENWKLVEPQNADETTESLYRFVRKMPAGKVLQFQLRQELVREELVELLPLDADKLEFYAKLGNVPQSVHDALAKVIELKRAVALTQQQIDQRRKQISDITSEQSRIRENMRAVAPSTDYYARLVKKLDQQETQIESLQKEAAGLQKQLDSQRKDLDTRINELTIA